MNYFIEWDNTLEMGITIIDIQHKTLFKKINKIYECIINKNFKNISSLLDEILTLSIHHFETEETFFFVFNYQNKEEHIAEHKELLKYLEQIRNEDIHLIDFNQNLFDYLHKWIINHIKDYDFKYIESLNSLIDKK